VSPHLSIWRAAFPLIASVVLLGLTRFEPLGLRALLNAEAPALSLHGGSLGTFSISAALVTRVDGILMTDAAWRMPLLYVPFIIPFLLVALISVPLLRLSARRATHVWGGAATRLGLPAVALAGALVFVKLMMHGEDAAPVVIIGRALADVAGAIHGPLWLVGAPLVGGLGSFFSGSATISNLTFGPVQAEIANGLGLNQSRVLALQSIGAAIGNMVCVHNIVAVAAVLGLTRAASHESRGECPKDGRPSLPEDPVSSILRLNFVPMIAACAAVGVGAALLSIA
jgi:lactate permease